MSELPQRSARLTDVQQQQIVRLSLRQVSQVEIARRVGVQRKTVRRVLRRTRAALTVNQDTEQDRADAIAVYREIQRTAWVSIDGGKLAPGPLLAEVRQAQQRIDTLLGTAPTSPDDPALELSRFKQTVLSVIQTEAPELGPAIAQRLLALREGSDTA